MAKPSKDNFQERIKALAFYGTSQNKVNESANQNTTLVEYKRTDDGVAYGIVKENHNYFIKKSNSKGDLNSTDFAFIGGLENKNKYKYNSLAEGQKNLGLVLKSINEAYSLGGVYNRMDESTSSQNVSESKEPQDVNSFLSDRIKQGKKSLTENTEKKFKASLQQKVEANTNKKGLMSEDAKFAIQKALGIVNEEALSTKDSEQKDSDDVNAQNDIEKGQSAALNQDGEKNQKDANKHMAKGNKTIEKADQSGAISVDESVEIKDTSKREVYTEKLDGESLSTKDSNIDPSVYNRPDKAFGNASYGGEKVKSLADSEINADDSLANQDGKGKDEAQSPVTDKNAKSKADSGLKTPKAPSTADSEIGDKGLATAKGSKEKPQSPVNDNNAKKKADAKMNESEDVSTADSEIEQSEAMANKKDAKDNPQAPINDKNAKAEADKRNAQGSKGAVTPEAGETSGDEDIVAEPVNEGEEGDPFKEKSKNTSDMSTDDSDQEDGDRVDNKDKHEKVDSYNSHYDPEMAHKEEKGEELKAKKEKGAIVVEGQQMDESLTKAYEDIVEKIKILRAQIAGKTDPDQATVNTIQNLEQQKQDMEKNLSGSVNEEDLSTADSHVDKGDMLAAEGNHGNMEYTENAHKVKEGGADFKMDQNSIAEEDAGDEETDAAAAAMDDLEIDVAQQDDAEEVQPEMGGEEPAPEGGEDVDLDINVDADEPAPEDGEEEGEEPYNEAKKKISDIHDIVKSNEFDDVKIKDIAASFLSGLEGDFAEMEVQDRKDIADDVLKAKPDAESGNSEVSGLEKGSDDAIDQQMADLEQGAGEQIPTDDAAQAPVQEDAEECSECGDPFEVYAESRGYSVDELHECGAEEMANIISGYRNNGGDDAQGVAVYVSDPAVAQELGDYGHSDFGEELLPFIGKVGEGVTDSHAVEPMPDVQEDEMGASAALDAAVDSIDNDKVDGSADAGDLGKLSKKEKKKAFNKVEKMAENNEEIPDVADLDDNGEISSYEEKRHNAIQSNMDEDATDDENVKMAMEYIAQIDADNTLPPQEKEKKKAFFQNVINQAQTQVAEQKPSLGGVGEVMAAGVRKPVGAALEYEDVQMNEGEKKIRKYVQNKLAELAGKKKPVINENKSKKLKALDNMIEEHFKKAQKKVAK